MSNPNQQVIVRSSGGGIGFLGLLTIVLVILRAFEIITISWLWVFAPIWVPVAILMVLGILFGLGFLLVITVAALSKTKK